jgi:hypothetical protein
LVWLTGDLAGALVVAKPVRLTADGGVLWVFQPADAATTLIDTRAAERVATGVSTG